LRQLATDARLTWERSIWRIASSSRSEFQNMLGVSPSS
jgi:hypothetical protein